jgi:hypothetical protein
VEGNGARRRQRRSFTPEFKAPVPLPVRPRRGPPSGGPCAPCVPTPPNWTELRYPEHHNGVEQSLTPRALSDTRRGWTEFIRKPSGKFLTSRSASHLPWRRGSVARPGSPSIGTNAIPHTGQVPGSGRRTVSSIGQPQTRAPRVSETPAAAGSDALSGRGRVCSACANGATAAPQSRTPASNGTRRGLACTDDSLSIGKASARGVSTLGSAPISSVAEMCP